MKHCKYCGKELHEQASFCPYCMKSQVEKQSAVIQEKKRGKWPHFLLIGGVIAAAVILCIPLMDDKEHPDHNSDNAIENTESSSTTSTESIVTTIANATTDTEQTTITTESTTVTETETIAPQAAFQLGDYLTEGKTLSQIQGYGSDEDMGGIVLTMEEITDTTIAFSIVLYSESGYASDTISARNITAEVIGTTAEFEFRDMFDGMGAGRITLEDGKMHIETWGVNDHPTSILVNTYLTNPAK